MKIDNLGEVYSSVYLNREYSFFRFNDFRLIVIGFSYVFLHLRLIRKICKPSLRKAQNICAFLLNVFLSVRFDSIKQIS